MTSQEVRDAAFGYLANGPMCVVALGADGVPVQINTTFERLMGPLFKFSTRPFWQAAAEPPHEAKLREAIETVAGSGPSAEEPIRARNVEMLTLEGEAGLPRRRHFDWSVGVGSDGCLLLFGDPCTDRDVEKRERDEELVDFFQNAPIAMHWLSGEGIVLWANQTELNVLGYTAEEYIGQPIMKFCPDEEELVLEIFKQLGSGSTIKDVPVRFRTKDGRVVDLLIDSNVKYDRHGQFGHTRCFIRDDTGRKIREARARLLLQETKRSLRQLDHFMSRTLHHLRTPLHVMLHTAELVGERLKSSLQGTSSNEFGDCLQLLGDATSQVASTVTLLNDVSDLTKLDQGMSLPLSPRVVDLRELGLASLAAATSKDQPPQVAAALKQGRVSLSLDMTGGGASTVRADAKVVQRIIVHLLRNAVEAGAKQVQQSKSPPASVSVVLSIGYPTSPDLCTFSVTDTGPGLDPEHSSSSSDSEGAAANPRGAAIFQRYQHAEIPEDLTDEAMASALRASVEKGLGSTTTNNLGMGLSLCYHLAQALGGELQFSSEPGNTKFWFTLPASASEPEQLAFEKLVVPQDAADRKKRKGRGTSTKTGGASAAASSRPGCGKCGSASSKKRFQIVDPCEVSMQSCVAQQGLAAAVTPLVLLVGGDSDVSVSFLTRSLNRLNCATKYAENGSVALSLLESAVGGMYSLVVFDVGALLSAAKGSSGLLDTAAAIKANPKLSGLPLVAMVGAGTSAGSLPEEVFEAQLASAGFGASFAKPMSRRALEGMVRRFCSGLGGNSAALVSSDEEVTERT